MMTSKHNVEQLINNLLQNDDFFTPSIIVFDNLKMEQWFQAYWLKTRDDIYMNIKCLRLKDLYQMMFKSLNVKILDVSLLNKYVVVSLSTWPDKQEVSYLYDDDKMNMDRLAEYAKILAKLFQKYDDDLFTPTGFQKKLYDQALLMAKSDGYLSLRELLDNYPIDDISNPVYIYTTRTLSPLENALLEKYPLYGSNTNNNLVIEKLTTAPSTLREIEALHSEVCTLLLNGVKASDICVYAPSIDEYTSDIEHVFRQSDASYPNVPFSMTKQKHSDSASILKKIKTISISHNCNRSDFVGIVKNKQVRNKYQIDDEALSVILDTIIKSNTYRIHDKIDDFVDLKKRILLAKLVDDEVTSLENQKYLAYNSISLTDTHIVILSKLIDLITQMEELDLSKEVSNESLDELEAIIQALLFNENDYQVFLMQRSINTFKELITKYQHHLTLSVILDSLIDEFDHLSVSTPLKGVTFLNLNERTIVDTKYAFVLGLSSNNYPRSQVNSLIDQNPVQDVKRVDSETLDKVFNHSEHIYVSYVNSNLKTDETYYPSPLLAKYKVNITQNIDVDETRSDEELFTKREFKNKNYLYKLLQNEEDEQLSTTVTKTEQRISLSSYDLESYLKEPLSSKVKLLLGEHSDDEVLELNNNYEPLALDAKTRSSLYRQMMLAMIQNQSLDLEEELLNLKKVLPTFPFDETEYTQMLNLCQEYIEKCKADYPSLVVYPLPTVKLNYSQASLWNEEKGIVSDYLKDYPDSSKYQNYLEHLNKNPKNNHDTISWTISGGNKIVVSKEASLTYLDLKFYTYTNTSTFARTYIYALVDLASMDEDHDYDIMLQTVRIKNDGFEKHSKSFKLSPSKARFLLNKMHCYLSDYTENVFIDVDKGLKAYTYTQLMLDAREAWGYFKQASLFEKEDLVSLLQNGVLTSPREEDLEVLYDIYLLKHRLLLAPILEEGDY